MNRLGVFIFYDASGIVDQYIEVLLEGLLTVLNKLVIVINGDLTDMSEKILRKYSDNIFIRENVGFDGGGYKDAFLNFLGNESWEYWNEVVLCNDTFYGPIFPWKQVFDRMQEEDIDFWGLSRYPGNESELEKGEYPTHIQSYFLVCRKRMLSSPFFESFWKNLDYPESRTEATRNFEVKFTTYFSENYFLGKAYMDVVGNRIILEHKGSPYIYYIYELLCELKFPVIKRNALTITNFKRAKKALNYIEKNTAYDVKLIYEHLKRLAEENRIKLINPVQLEIFYNTHNRIFIYGNGEYGKNIASYFEYKGWKYAGFIVSEKMTQNEVVYAYSDIEFVADDGIVLALGKKAFQEVYSMIKNDFMETQLFLLRY